MIVINLKTYSEVTEGDKPVELAKIAQEVFDKYQVPFILCVQATDIYRVTQAVNIPVYAQHIDPIQPGKNTGFISALAVKEAGAVGVMINHSEHRIGMQAIAEVVEIANQYELNTMVCVENADEGAEVDKFNVGAIALEDPVLIGGTESIVKNDAGKKKVEEFVAMNLQGSPLVGAGVKDQNDVKVSIQIGAKGVLLASGFDLADDPRAVLEDLCQGFR